MDKPIFVTFQIRPASICRDLGMKTKYYAVKCNTMEDALEVASDLNSMDGISYLKINKSGRFQHKEETVLCNKENYLKSI